MKKKISLVITDYKGHYQAEATVQGYTVSVEGHSEAELKKEAEKKLREEEELKPSTEIEWDVKWN